MKWIVITRPDFFHEEAAYIDRLFLAGLDYLHLRKPGSTPDPCCRLLDAIDSRWHPRIIIHDHFELCRTYALRGIHLNRRHPQAPMEFKGHVSCSCHSISEAAERKDACDYIFLSPIFDSISKQGYAAAYTNEELCAAARQGIIDSKVIALGGVTPDRLPLLQEWNFGGAAFLGAVWNEMGMPQTNTFLHALETAIHM